MSKLFQVYGVGQALIPVLPPPLHFENPPTSSQDNYAIGQQVFVGDVGAYTFYIYNGAGVWEQVNTGSVPFDSLSDGTTTVSPNTVGNIAIIGTANQVDVVSNAPYNLLEVSIPNSFTPPGVVNLNSAVNFGTTANVSVDSGASWNFGNLPAFNGGLDVAAGSLNISGARSKLLMNATGGSASVGTATLVGGTVTVLTASVSASSIILISANGLAGTPGFLSLGAIVPVTSFIINSTSGTDTSTVNYLIIN